jgi:hypothetical protein
MLEQDFNRYGTKRDTNFIWQNVMAEFSVHVKPENEDVVMQNLTLANCQIGLTRYSI